MKLKGTGLGRTRDAFYTVVDCPGLSCGGGGGRFVCIVEGTPGGLDGMEYHPKERLVRGPSPGKCLRLKNKILSNNLLLEML